MSKSLKAGDPLVLTLTGFSAGTQIRPSLTGPDGRELPRDPVQITSSSQRASFPGTGIGGWNVPGSPSGTYRLTFPVGDASCVVVFTAAGAAAASASAAPAPTVTAQPSAPLSSRPTSSAPAASATPSVLPAATTTPSASAPPTPPTSPFGPWGVALDPTTNRVYITSNRFNGFAVVNGATNRPIGYPVVGAGLGPIAVNAATNRIYGAHQDLSGDNNSILVIDGETNQVVATVPLGLTFPVDVAVNVATNRVYVPTFLGTVLVIDGATNRIVATAPGLGVGFLHYIAVNPATNRVYVTGSRAEGVLVIDGANNQAIATVPVGFAFSIAVNPATNRVYAAVADCPNTLVSPDPCLTASFGAVAVVDGTSNQVVGTVNAYTAVARNYTYLTAFLSFPVAINAVTNRLYVVGVDAGVLGRVYVIDGATNQTLGSVAVGLTFGFDGVLKPATHIAVNATMNRVYVVDNFSGALFVIDGTTNQVVATVALGSGP